MKDLLSIITEAVHGAKTLFEVMSGTAKILCSSGLVITIIIINIVSRKNKRRG